MSHPPVIIEHMFVGTATLDPGSKTVDAPGGAPALAGVSAAIDELLEAESSTLDANSAAASIAALERECRRLQAAQVELLGEIDSSGVYSADGHFSARVMMRHHAQLSGTEASKRFGVYRALTDLPSVAAAYSAGSVGTDQVRRISRVWSNARVRGFMFACESEFLVAATSMEFPDFDSFCGQWEQAIDADGAHKQAEKRWQRRNIHSTQDFNGMWSFDGRMMSLDGAEFHEILTKLADAERLADIEAAQIEHGTEWRLHLPRSSAQLRYDAFMSLIRRGAVARPGGGRAEIVTNVVIDQQSFEKQLALLCGTESEPTIPAEIASAIIAGTRFSRTAGGTWVNPAEIVAHALTNQVRRVVINSSSVVIDVGRSQRLFTGSPRLAAMLQNTRCYWHGCWTPATKCQIDHVIPFREGGETNPQNGQPACRGHNLIKEQGYHAWRNRDGTWTIQRPDGAIIPEHTSQWHQPRAG